MTNGPGQRSGGRILRQDDVQALRTADRLLHDAKAMHARALAEVDALRDETLRRARAEALRERATAAATMIARAEIDAETRLRNLEPEIGRLVADTVLQVIGALDGAEAVTRATASALERLKDHRRARIRVAPDVADAVRAAVASVGGTGAEVMSVTVDERLEPGRCILSSGAGHVEIGLAAQIEAATRPWRGDAPATEEAS